MRLKHTFAGSFISSRKRGVFPPLGHLDGLLPQWLVTASPKTDEPGPVGSSAQYQEPTNRTKRHPGGHSRVSPEPANLEEAHEMLPELQGTTHQVVTAP